MGFCPFLSEGSCVSGVTLVVTGGLLCYFACDRCIRCLYVFCIITTYASRGASLSVFCKVVGCLSPLVTDSFDFCLRYENLVTYRTVLTFGKTGLFTSRSNCRVDYFLVSGSRGFISIIAVSAARTGIGRVTFLRTGRSGYYGLVRVTGGGDLFICCVFTTVSLTYFILFPTDLGAGRSLCFDRLEIVIVGIDRDCKRVRAVLSVSGIDCRVCRKELAASGTSLISLVTRCNTGSSYRIDRLAEAMTGCGNVLNVLGLAVLSPLCFKVRSVCGPTVYCTACGSLNRSDCRCGFCFLVGTISSANVFSGTRLSVIGPGIGRLCPIMTEGIGSLVCATELGITNATVYNFVVASRRFARSVFDVFLYGVSFGMFLFFYRLCIGCTATVYGTGIGFYTFTCTGRFGSYFTFVPRMCRCVAIRFTTVYTLERMSCALAVAIALDCACIGVLELSNYKGCRVILTVGGILFSIIGKVLVTYCTLLICFVTFINTGCRIVSCSLAKAVTLSRDYVLCFKNHATCRTVLIFRKSGFGTGSIYCGFNYNACMVIRIFCALYFIGLSSCPLSCKDNGICSYLLRNASSFICQTGGIVCLRCFGFIAS